MEKGCYHEGVPAMTVIIDGGWSKMSHKHSYNAKSGVAIILGKETGKLLYMRFATSIANLVLDRFQRRNTIVSKTGADHLLRWRRTSFWRGFWKLRRCTVFVTLSS